MKFDLNHNRHTLTYFKPHLKYYDMLKIIEKITNNGFKIILFKEFELNYEEWQKFYFNIKDCSFFKEVVNSVKNKKLFAAILEYSNENENCITSFRKLLGNTNPLNANFGSIRKEFGINISNNALHGSDSYDSLLNEFKIIFK